MRELIYSAYTERGDVKTENQDSIFARTVVAGGRAMGLFIVADGCGGLANGAQASRLVTKEFERIWNEGLTEKCDLENEDEVTEFFKQSLERINDRVLEFSAETGEKCGSTVSLLFVYGKRYYILQLGDSRIYRLRLGMKQLTEDQTLVADMVRKGELSETEALTHKKRHVLNMCIGYFKRLRIYVSTGRLRNRDIIILCSDGIYKSLDTGLIRKISKPKRNFQNAAVRLRSAIPNGMARDNVSAVIVRSKRRWGF